MDNAAGDSAKFTPVTLHVETQQLILSGGGAFGTLNDEFRIRPDLQCALWPLDGSVNVPLGQTLGCHALQEATGFPSHNLRDHIDKLAPHFDVDPYIIWDVRVCCRRRCRTRSG